MAWQILLCIFLPAVMAFIAWKFVKMINQYFYFISDRLFPGLFRTLLLGEDICASELNIFIQILLKKLRVSPNI